MPKQPCPTGNQSAVDVVLAYLPSGGDITEQIVQQEKRTLRITIM